MSLLNQLQAAASTLPVQKPRQDHRLKNLLLGHQAQTDKAVVRYREVMSGKGWMTQRDVENALGYASTVATPFLTKLRKQGLIERRNRHGSTVYERRQGYEWRWVGGAA